MFVYVTFCKKQFSSAFDVDLLYVLSRKTNVLLL